MAFPDVSTFQKSNSGEAFTELAILCHPVSPLYSQFLLVSADSST